ncbi:MAG: single-stranded-DNA-specific exonuclease RecJ [Gammaproteobacteria bacterium]|nr:single-stranded-DNA-specific exonuclease RecJ [Gammaproteobacteria bacterium]MDE2345686.1 single-stranded-DNA-specific exonuclease RecJ [Gammaproteobacteria bacterium]
MSSLRIERRVTVPAGNFPAGLHPLLQRIYAGRQIQGAGELDYRLSALHDFHAFRNIDAAVLLLADCVQAQKHILIVGDFDADGATSTALGVRTLRKMGARRVDYLIPNRFEYGYGLTPEIVALAAKRDPDLIITVDNGISSLQGVEAARAAGIRVLVTDHHLPGPELPLADAILNPNLPGDPFPSKHLAGVGVLFYLLLALRSHLRECGWFMACGIPEPNLAEHLDIVALGTVADLVQFDHNNRILVYQGLERIRAGRCVPGIHALLDLGKRNLRRLSASDLGFAVAPRLNAAGRLSDMSLGVECLLADEPAKAWELAERLDELNHQRRNIEVRMREEAMRVLEPMVLNPADPALPFGVCLFNEEWHQGVVGLVASRIKDRLHRPVVAFARGEDRTLKGSARSVKNLHIRDVLEAVATRQPGLITRFGGHSMAAGLTLAANGFADFARIFDAEVRHRLGNGDLTGVMQTDGDLEAQFITLETVELLRAAGPWGQGFPEPSFDGTFHLLERRIVGGKHLRLLLAERLTGLRLEAIVFNNDGSRLANGSDQVRIVYRPDINEYRGERRLQLLVDAIEPVASL